MDLWHFATVVDFAMSQLGSPELQLRRLATDDQLEMKLRRLASYVYGTRTGDKEGAASMLAVQPPGAGFDLVPAWLVAEATQHSKDEFQREERVHRVPGARARGSGGKDTGGKGAIGDSADAAGGGGQWQPQHKRGGGGSGKSGRKGGSRLPIG